jgi:pimeloyl-ACP methyl ester carboxylesterase
MRIAVNDIELYFDVEGAGLVPDGMVMRERPTIVALHGGPGFDHAYFKPFLEPLTETAQIIYLDLRCQGRSSHPPVETCTLEQMADDVAAFCHALGLERPTILGHSAGGFVALTLAVRHPDVAGRYIFASTSAGGTGGDPAALERRVGAEGVAIAGRVFGGDFSDAAMADFFRVVVPTYLHDPSAPTAGPTLAATGRSSFNTELAGYFFTHEIGRHDVRARLGEIDVPSLVIVGESDWVCAPAASRTIAAGIPGAELVILPEAGHFLFGEQNEAFTSAIRRFVGAPALVGVGGL